MLKKSFVERQRKRKRIDGKDTNTVKSVQGVSKP